MISLLCILAMLLLFSLSIFVHELGHFLAARALGLVADVFSIGMGKALWKRKRGDTVFQIGWLPFGGYVALPQMDPNSFLEGPRDSRAKSVSESQSASQSIRTPDPDTDSDSGSDSSPAPRALPRVAPWKKIIVSVAGAAGNMAFAFLLATIVWIVMRTGLLAIPTIELAMVATIPAPFSTVMFTGDMRGVIWWAVCLAVDLLIWYPFFKTYEKQEVEKEAAEALAKA